MTKRTLHFSHAGPLVQFDTASGILRTGDLNPQVDIRFVMTPRDMILLSLRALWAGIVSLRHLEWNTR